MTDRPLLILVHGTRFDARQWRGYDTLVPDAELLPIDLPGHGSRAGDPWDSAAALDVVDDAVRTAGPDRPIVLAGHSLGGYVATTYAHRHPDRLAALVLVGACADPSKHPRLVYLYTGFARLLPLIGADRMATVANAVMRRLGAQAQDVPDATGYAATPAAWAGVVAEARADQLAPVTCPVYLVAGQYDQLRIDLAAYARACRDGRTRVIPRASHLAPVTHRAQVAEVFREAVAAATAPEDPSQNPPSNA
ncbi:alpha/beta fold hydrolase [Austwickia chelonae]|uniref:alpha/beta fold hydrolase n=1 Tax=Austwickia chelonae TaxID=100225 RepID=UPI001FE07E2E|nr:alpha/beta hydrolase [Austwickia chelonae]